MRDERKNIKEPFEPADTPNPPQRIDPDTAQKRENPVKDGERKTDSPQNKDENKGRAHLLDEDTDIDDETTI